MTVFPSQIHTSCPVWAMTLQWLAEAVSHWLLLVCTSWLPTLSRQAWSTAASVPLTAHNQAVTRGAVAPSRPRAGGDPHRISSDRSFAETLVRFFACLWCSNRAWVAIHQSGIQPRAERAETTTETCEVLFRSPWRVSALTFGEGSFSVRVIRDTDCGLPSSGVSGTKADQ